MEGMATSCVHTRDNYRGSHAMTPLVSAQHRQVESLRRPGERAAPLMHDAIMQQTS